MNKTAWRGWMFIMSIGVIVAILCVIFSIKYMFIPAGKLLDTKIEQTITELFPNNTFATEQTNSENKNTINVPDGYKFVDMDDEGRYYIIENAKGNQQVVIIEKNEK